MVDMDRKECPSYCIIIIIFFFYNPMQPLPHFKNFPDVAECEIMHSGHVACPGCGAALAMRLALKVLGPETILVIPACCWAVIDGPFPYSASGVPVYQAAFETAAITAGAWRVRESSSVQS